MAELRRPLRIWEKRRGKRVLSREYLHYLRSITRLTDDERETFRDLGVHLTNQKIAGIEDLYGAAAFIEGNRV